MDIKYLSFPLLEFLVSQLKRISDYSSYTVDTPAAPPITTDSRRDDGDTVPVEYASRFDLKLVIDMLE
jgi:hypothetical protein